MREILAEDRKITEARQGDKETAAAHLAIAGSERIIIVQINAQTVHLASGALQGLGLLASEAANGEPPAGSMK